MYSRFASLGSLLFVSFSLLACAGQPPGPASRAIAWQCSEQMKFDAVADDVSARLSILGNEQTLPRTAADSGARYANKDTVFWITGKEAMLELEGEKYECKVDRMIQMAREAGIDFRAIGQEPGWILDIVENSGFILQYDYGQQRAQMPWAAPEVLDDGTRIYFTEKETHSLKVVIEPGLCHDSMSGQAFAFTVRLAYDDMHLKGCGREL